MESFFKLFCKNVRFYAMVQGITVFVVGLSIVFIKTVMFIAGWDVEIFKPNFADQLDASLKLLLLCLSTTSGQKMEDVIPKKRFGYEQDKHPWDTLACSLFIVSCFQSSFVHTWYLFNVLVFYYAYTRAKS